MGIRAIVPRKIRRTAEASRFVALACEQLEYLVGVELDPVVEPELSGHALSYSSLAEVGDVVHSPCSRSFALFSSS
jgi:hypothetical protein